MKSVVSLAKYPIKINFSLENFALNLFLMNCIIDPANSLFHTKQITFFFALFANYKNLRFNNFPVFNFIIFYLAFFFSTALMMIRNINFDSGFVNMYSTTFLLLLIFFIDNEKIKVDTGFNLSCFIIATLTIVLSLIIIKIPASAILVIENEKLKKIFMFAEHKRFLYWWISGVFHRASPLLIIQLGIIFRKFLSGHKKRNLFFTVYYLLAMFFTGTRANIFAALLVVGLIYIYNLYFVRRKVYITVFLCLIFMLFAGIMLFLLLTVKNSSSDMKDAHMISYNILFSEHPSYILFGQGPGAYFYDVGWKNFCTNTEMSYMELLRMFGIFFTVMIISLYCYPFIYFIKRQNLENFCISISYLAYLFIAGTNPLLIGPTGFLAFWYINYLYCAERRHYG